MKWAVFLIACSITPTFLFGIDYERFELNGKVGLRDGTGHVLLPADFDALGWSDGNFSVIGKITGYRKKDRWGLINLNKEFITPAEFGSLTWAGGDRVIASKAYNLSSKFGCLNLMGKNVIPFTYDDLVIDGLRAIVMLKRGVRYEYGLIDLDDKQVLPVSFQEITPVGSLRYAIKNFDNKIALCTEDGQWITEFSIDNITDFSYDHAIIVSGWRKGVINRSGEIIVPPLYRDIRISGPDTIEGLRATEWKIIDTQYKTLQTVEADQLNFELTDWTRITIDHKVGLIDEQFKERWIPAFEFIGSPSGNIVLAKRGKKWAMLDRKQREILPFVFDSLCLTGNVVRAVQKLRGTKTWELYDTVGVLRSGKRYETIENYNGKFFPVRSRGYWGAMDRYGNENVACVYDSLLQSMDNLIVVRFKGKYGVITTSDQWQILPQSYPITLVDSEHYLEKQDSTIFLKDLKGNAIYFTTNALTALQDRLIERLPDGQEKVINLQGQLVARQDAINLPSNIEQTFRESEGLIGIKRDGKFGFVDTRGRLRIANRYDNIGEFHDGLAPVSLLGKWGFINKMDQIVIQPTFDTTENFDNKLALVSRNGKFGLIDVDGNTLLELRYDSIKKLSNGYFKVIQQSLKGMADNRGRVLIEPRFNSIEPVDKNLVIVEREKLFGVLTYDGLSIFPLEFRILNYISQKRVFLAKKEADWESIPSR